MVPFYYFLHFFLIYLVFILFFSRFTDRSSVFRRPAPPSGGNRAGPSEVGHLATRSLLLTAPEVGMRPELVARARAAADASRAGVGPNTRSRARAERP